MKVSVLVGIVVACIVTTQAQELQAEESASLDEIQREEQQQQQQQLVSLSASTSEDASGSVSGQIDLFDSTSASASASTSGSWDDAIVGDSASTSASDASATTEESGSSSEAPSVSSSASDTSSVSSDSGDITQESLIDSSESLEASAATSTNVSSDGSDFESNAASAESGSASEASAASSTTSSSTTSSSDDGSGSTASGSGNINQSDLFNSTSGSQDSTAATKTPEPSISVEDSVQLSESFGGPHGTEFSDEAVATSGQTVVSITIRAGKRIDGVALEITAPVATIFNHGGGGGDPKTLTLGPGEYITSMEAHWGKRNGHTRIFYLRFGTNAGNFLEGGSKTDSKATVTAPEGFQLGGFFGRDGDEIDLLGAIWTSIAVVTPAPGAPTPAPTPWVEKKIGHDEVVPFKQPEPVTIAEKAAIKFKPQLHITNGCHAYPAVNVGGQTSGGLKTTGAPSAGCKGSGWGSQVYGRSTWHNGVWAIMYSWYFPKDSPSTGLGHRHDWEHVIVWIDNPEIAEPKILAVTPSAHSGYSAQVPPDANKVDGNSVKVKYLSKWPINHALESTGEAGDYQDLIMWEQLTDAARLALQNTGFGKANVPMKDGNFVSKLDKAWPFKN
ncbi:hypothetical protein PPTG_08017 [Phytophthora nicotianae INRA-310]|uniref:Jacalin-type lectin domain-containing protein n=1 Tax=Phytophthora nicotianae (strain INRA-310) TaxID=761204 RepID=W2QIT6_PHYN3|nr:hypothetical protein PPTG_08017 [Phytophthora nicotianae INRA-310]ETN13083.1 hypothetical protein PPTG_08017 [Phytophthora nicotianae INRA-310]